MKKRHNFQKSLHIMGQKQWKEREIMDGEQRTERAVERDIDDLIFEGEQWYPSER